MPPPVVAALPERVESLTVSVLPGSLAMPAAIDGVVAGQGHVGERQRAGVVDGAAIAVDAADRLGLASRDRQARERGSHALAPGIHWSCRRR